MLQILAAISTVVIGKYLVMAVFVDIECGFKHFLGFSACSRSCKTLKYMYAVHVSNMIFSIMFARGCYWSTMMHKADTSLTGKLIVTITLISSWFSIVLMITYKFYYCKAAKKIQACAPKVEIVPMELIVDQPPSYDKLKDIHS